jgi:hypothetical protein
MIAYRALGQRGRLGNALYELAATVGIALDLGEEPVFPANWLHRPYFSVPDEFFADEIPPYVPDAQNFCAHLDARCRDYLQDINLFWPYIDLIRDYFQPSEFAQQTLDTIAWPVIDGPIAALHVRRGDNVFDPGVANKNDYHLQYPAEYYRHSLTVLPQHRDLAIFSDDVPWCRSNLPPACFYSVGAPYAKEHEPSFGTYEPTDWIDLFLMSRCDQFSVTGSTFGIWAALLADVPPQNVVRPSKVYGPFLDYIDADLLFLLEWGIAAC